MNRKIFIRLCAVSFLLMSLFLWSCGGGGSGRDNGDDKSSPPTVNAGDDKIVVAGSKVNLSGIINDPDDDISTIKWTQISGNSVQLEDSDKANASFTATVSVVDQSLEFQLEAKDSKSQSSTDTIKISITGKNPDAAANAGPDRQGSATKDFSNPTISEIIFIDGSESSGCSFQWTVVSSPENSKHQLSSSNTPSTGFYGDTQGKYTLKLVADNCQQNTAEDEVVITLIKDTDNDGVSDNDDLDRDGDSYLNDDDAFADNRASHLDYDNDGTGNYYEDDVDGDGTIDLEDDFPLNPSSTKANTYTEATEKIASNQNDGISVSEIAGSSPIKISGVNYSASGPDLDYFRVAMTTGIYSVVVESTDKNMTPSIALITASGTTLPSTGSNFVAQDGVSGIGVSVPNDGNYYLVITDASGNSSQDWNYRADIFPDTDMDGIQDDLEKAIDSNDLSPDSDGDSILDYIEIKYAAKDWANNKDTDNDGLPPWWDMDSDGDTIPDGIEYYTRSEKPSFSADEIAKLNDADGDGTMNFADINSDNTSYADDKVQAGVNPSSPLDTDKDGIPDFIDEDNDNDGLKDSEETLATYNVKLMAPGAQGTNVADGLLIKRVYHEAKNIDNLCIAGDNLLVEAINTPDSASDLKAVFNTIDGAVTQVASSLNNGKASFTCPDNLENGLVEFYLASAGKRSGAVALQVRSNSAPLIKEVQFDSDTTNVTINGENLNQQLTINFAGASSIINNTYGSSDEFNLLLPAGAKDGYMSVSSATGQSNEVWLKITRQITGIIQSPNTGVDVTKLDVSLSLEDEIFPSSDGSFITDASITKPTTISALLEKAASTEEVPQYGLYLSAIIFPDSSSVTLNSQSTATSLVWNGLGIDQLVEESSFGTIYSGIENLEEVKALTSTLKTKLESNSQILSEKDTELTQAFTNALKATSKYVAESGKLKTVSAMSLARMPRGLFGEDAKVTPSEADDISVYEHNDSGNITVENDTQLFLSVKITASDGTILKNHITGMNGMVGPQGYGLLFRASTKQFNQPKGKNAIVEVISPGIGAEYNPKQLESMSMSVWKKLYFRTIVERVIWPLLKEVLPLPESDVVDIIWDNAPNLVDIVVNKALSGDVSGSVEILVESLLEDMLSAPPGPITQAIAKKKVKDASEKKLVKRAIKIVAKNLPFLRNIRLVLKIAEVVDTGANVAKTIVDIASTDAVIHFNVTFPLSIEKVQPGKVLPNGTDKVLEIVGSGFTQIQRGWWPFETYLKPKVKITDKDGIEVTAKINTISSDGTSMSIVIPGWYLDENTKGPLSVEIHHPYDTPEAKVSKADAIEITKELELTSISPSQGGVGIAATVYGVGFSTNPAGNQVTIGGKSTLISTVTENSLDVVIPTSLEPGSHDVIVKVKEDGIWSDPSNSVSYEVVQGNVSIVVCDDGGAKDDAFALYVDGIYVGTMYASNSDYCDTYTPILNVGPHTAMLVGVEAPDSIGTYSIRFNGVSGLTGSSTSGSDLTPGVRKTYNFNVDPQTGGKSVQKLRTIQQSLNKCCINEVLIEK